jgi:hypothetical protein
LVSLCVNSQLPLLLLLVASGHWRLHRCWLLLLLAAAHRILHCCRSSSTLS